MISWKLNSFDYRTGCACLWVSYEFQYKDVVNINQTAVFDVIGFCFKAQLVLRPLFLLLLMVVLLVKTVVFVRK